MKRYAVGFVLGLLVAIGISASGQMGTMGFIMGSVALSDSNDAKRKAANLEQRMLAAEQRITALEKK